MCLDKWYKSYPEYSGYTKGSIKGECPVCRDRGGFKYKEAMNLSAITLLALRLEEDLDGLEKNLNSISSA
jgi:hypothetical protein